MVGLYVIYVLFVAVGSWWENRQADKKRQIREARGEYEDEDLDNIVDGDVEWEGTGECVSSMFTTSPADMSWTMSRSNRVACVRRFDPAVRISRALGVACFDPEKRPLLAFDDAAVLSRPERHAPVALSVERFARPSSLASTTDASHSPSPAETVPIRPAVLARRDRICRRRPLALVGSLERRECPGRLRRRAPASRALARRPGRLDGASHFASIARDDGSAPST